MAITTWKVATIDGNYSNINNWTAGVPSASDTALFDESTITNIGIATSITNSVGEWIFESGAYNFYVTDHYYYDIGSPLVFGEVS
jgi:hypothetical protein